MLLSDKSRSLQYSLGFGGQGLSFARMEKARSVLPRGRRGGRWPCCQHPGLPGDTTVETCHRSRECHAAEAAGCGHLCRLPGHPALRCLQHRWLGRHAGHRVRHCHGHRGAVTSARARFDGSQFAQSGTTLSLCLPVLVGLLVGPGASATVLTCGARRVPPCPPCPAPAAPRGAGALLRVQAGVCLQSPRGCAGGTTQALGSRICTLCVDS